MTPEEHVEQMELDGRLTDKQVEVLRASVQGGEEVSPHKPARRRHRRIYTMSWYVGIAIMTASTVFVLSSGAAETVTTVNDVIETLNQPGAHGQINNSLSNILGAVVLLIVPVLFWVWLHNSLVVSEERVFKFWAQTESNFQRRADLVPALIDTISRYLRHEMSTLTQITEMRTKASGQLAKVIDKLINARKKTFDLARDQEKTLIDDEKQMTALVSAQSALKSDIDTVIATVEAYPDLKSSDQFLELQAQLEGTENRINVARMRFNEAVGNYNGRLRSLPWSLVAGLGNFHRKAYFKSPAEAHNVPALKFQ